MLKITRTLVLLVAAALPALAQPGSAGNRPKNSGVKAKIAERGVAVLWRQPADIRSRNLYYGPGGRRDAPHTIYTFIKEDLHGTNPKFVVRDENGVKWKVKLGLEARPETAASRLVWAVGYFSSEDYMVPRIVVEGLPDHLKRGQNLVAADGSIPNVRLKRDLTGEKKIGPWKWRRNSFPARELNGLRVMMALINNWDLTDQNNSIYAESGGARTDEPEEVAMVRDLGASFGTTGRNLREWDKGNPESYERSKFITKITPTYVDFATPSRPMFVYFFSLPEFIRRWQLRWIGKHIPRQDARWTGSLLAQLSPRQISSAFRAAGYSPADVSVFTAVVERRIEALKQL